MKDYIKSLSVSLFLFGTLAILTATSGPDSSHSPAPDTSTGSAAISSPGRNQSRSPGGDMLPEKIPLPEDADIQAFVYNPLTDTLSAITCHKDTYQLLLPDSQGSWTRTAQWTVAPEDRLTHFAYSPEGKLYACKRSGTGNKAVQSLVYLGRKGTLSTVPLVSLEQPPGTPSGPGAKKKNLKKSSIAQLCFSGTILAITYHDSTVKFYNIAEGRALGSPSIRGETGRHIFYDYHYLSPIGKDASPTGLTDYDIRTGQASHTIALAGSGTWEKEYWLSNYRSQVWLLSGNGLFSGIYTDSVFTQVLSREELGLPDGGQIRFFQAGRDQTLYISYLDKEGILCLVRLTIRNTAKKDAEKKNPAKNELDSSLSI